ncbi:MAG: NUDIX domain-containing protein [Burkholderiaceae bacterium]|nr:NUDIX domain-containing protein [Burkholderiaceae bacterium]
MGAEPSRPVPAVPAATAVLIRNGPGGLEVLMVERHHEIDFARGAAVFPGGKAAAADRDDRLRTRCADAALDELQRSLRIAAVRETFEESALLLARRRGEVLGAESGAALWRGWHARVLASADAFVEMVCEEDLELALDLLVPFAHWVTPEVSPKRFDTHFFIAQAPAGQVAVHDGREAVDAFWVRPADAMAECEQRRRVIIFPTLCNLALLAQATDVSAAMAAAGARSVQRIQPTLARRADGKTVPALPADSGYPALSPALMDQVAR